MRPLRVHLVGIGGIGMAGLAGLLSARGLKVTGSESRSPYPPASQVLKALGISPFIGYRAENLDQVKPEAVVVGNVIRADNPEVKRAKELGLPLYSLPSALEEWVFPGKKVLVVAGTHGKTTSTALLAHILETLSVDPAYLIGGVLRSSRRNYRWGEGEWLVIEGDEYDSAFFDKVPKFWHYRPFAAILTSVEYDHADIYPDYASLFEAFRRFVELLPREGLLVFCGEDPGAKAVSRFASCRKVSYGRTSSNDYVLEEMETEPRGSRLRIGTPRGRETVWIPLWGEHNALNALAVTALGLELGFPWEDLKAALSSFPGVSRRQEVLYQGKITVIDDFAHHPTAVRVTLSALRQAFRPSRLRVCFEPRTNTSKRRIFEKDYLKSLSLADEVILKEPPGMEKIPEGERLDLSKLKQGLEQQGIRARIVGSFPKKEQPLQGEGPFPPLEGGAVVVLESEKDVGSFLGRTASEGDLVVFMSSASFGEVYSELISILKDRGL